LQNDGITHAHRGLYLSTDLCPSSKKGFERRLYEALIRHFPHPVPVTLFITKRWLEGHPAAFEWLKNRDKNGELAITWGNHTAWHHYHPGKPLNENFVLSPEENLTADVLTLEKSLLEHGVTPSVFFRFPGLVSDRRAFQTVTGLGLITIGSNAWLAKGQKPKEGSIILVHGNRNEPKGVAIFLKMLQRGEIPYLDSLSRIKNPKSK
jgi:peptidoglycan/xylan/chitin deacetylase (PgdA/CDA1 family)